MSNESGVCTASIYASETTWPDYVLEKRLNVQREELNLIDRDVREIRAEQTRRIQVKSEKARKDAEAKAAAEQAAKRSEALKTLGMTEKEFTDWKTRKANDLLSIYAYYGIGSSRIQGNKYGNTYPGHSNT